MSFWFNVYVYCCCCCYYWYCCCHQQEHCCLVVEVEEDHWLGNVVMTAVVEVVGTVVEFVLGFE